MVGRIGDDVSEGCRTARLTSTYTGKAKTMPTATMTISSTNVRLRVAVHDAAFSLRASTAYCPAETTATMTVSTTASAML